MRVLLIAHYFPPDGGAGSQRPASLAQHLPELGVELTVVCRALPEAVRGTYDPADASLVRRTAQAAVRRASLQPDESWTTALLRTAREVCEEQRPDIVLVTLSPFEHASIAFELQREFSLPVVLDLRDPWALDGWHTYRDPWQWRGALRTMQEALERADGVVMNVPGARAAAQSLAPRRGKTPYEVVTNGWEESDFPKPLDVPVGDAMRIRFAGTFVCRFVRDRSPWRRFRALLRGRGESIDERGRSPLFLLAAMRRLRDQHGGDAFGNIRLEIAGAREPETTQLIEESGCADAVDHLGYLPHDQSAQFIAQADLLLLPMHGLPRGGRARMVPGKLYEYFATGRPILGLCPMGEARDWILRDARSRVSPPTDVASITASLREMHACWTRGEFVRSQRGAWTNEFTRAAQAARMLEYLALVLQQRAPMATQRVPSTVRAA